MVEKDQKLVLAILEFLETSMVDGSVCEDDKNGIEVASKSSYTDTATEPWGFVVVLAIALRLGQMRRTPRQHFSLCLYASPQFNALVKRLESTFPTQRKDRN